MCELTIIIIAYRRLVSFEILTVDSPSDGDDEEGSKIVG
jgi:hypothetical protein